MESQKLRALQVRKDDDGKITAAVIEMTVGDLDEGNVVIRAEFSGVNYKDALAATGAGRGIMRDFPKVAGIDVAGVVAESSDSRYRPGDKVLITGYKLGVDHDGGFAEFVRAPADWLVPLPGGISAREAMTVGTAGFTAALSVMRLMENGLAPENGKVIVLGATGGVGGFAVAFLAKLGFQVTAVTGKAESRDYLQKLGASEILLRNEIERGEKPLEKPMWAGAVDPVGGDWLAWLTRTLKPGAAAAVSGLTGGVELKTTVMPFILRGVSVLGIDSVFCPADRRLRAWEKIADEWKPKDLEIFIAEEVDLDGLGEVFPKLIGGKMQGRALLRI